MSSGDSTRGAIMKAFISHPSVESVLAEGETKSAVVLKGGIQCDLRIVRDEEFPFALNYFTGSKEHNVEMRSRARRLGLSLNEYGFTRVENGKAPRKPVRLPRVREEKDIYAALQLPYIPPELREDTGEFDAADKEALPALISEKDIRGTFHCHSTYSDGVNTIADLVSAAKKLDWDYIGIADHSRAAAYAGGLTGARVRQQIAEIDELNSRMPGFTVFKGTECDILADGSLDWPTNVLALFDYVVVSVHSNFRMTQAEMTKRIIKALKNRHVTMLGHPTGRLLLSREPYPVDMIAVIDAAADHGKAIEINAHPMRLDLDWRLCKYAKEKGVKIFINPDAHTVEGLHDVSLGVGIARKGWLESADVVNTWDTAAVVKHLKEVKG
jgi:DNA polymerase (family 10)